MIITRSPLRISLGGGGTDLPSYYREHGGFLIAGAIDKFVYITLHETFMPESSSGIQDGDGLTRRGDQASILREPCCWYRSKIRTSKSPACPIFPPAPAWGRRAASLRRCCARCMPIAGIT